jgi:hypothetical protein
MFIFSQKTIENMKPVLTESKIIESHTKEDSIDPSQIIGVLDQKTQIRQDVKSWIDSQSLDSVSKNLIENLALVDQAALSKYDTKDNGKLSTLVVETNKRIFCLMNKTKNKSKTVKIMSGLRQATLNSKDRINAFNLLNTKSSKLNLVSSELRDSPSVCDDLMKKIVPISF